MSHKVNAMYSIELDQDVASQIVELHPRRLKQVILRVFALQHNPRPPECVILDAESCRIPVGPYRILYQVDDSVRRVRIVAIREHSDSD